MFYAWSTLLRIQQPVWLWDFLGTFIFWQWQTVAIKLHHSSGTQSTPNYCYFKAERLTGTGESRWEISVFREGLFSHSWALCKWNKMTFITASRECRVSTLSYITTNGCTLAQTVIHNLWAKLIWVQSMRPAYAEEISPLAYFILMPLPIDSPQVAQILLLSPRSFCFDLHKPCV